MKTKPHFKLFKLLCYLILSFFPGKRALSSSEKTNISKTPSWSLPQRATLTIRAFGYHLKGRNPGPLMSGHLPLGDLRAISYFPGDNHAVAVFSSINRTPAIPSRWDKYLYLLSYQHISPHPRLEQPVAAGWTPAPHGQTPQNFVKNTRCMIPLAPNRSLIIHQNISYLLVRHGASWRLKPLSATLPCDLKKLSARYHPLRSYTTLQFLPWHGQSLESGHWLSLYEKANGFFQPFLNDRYFTGVLCQRCEGQTQTSAILLYDSKRKKPIASSIQNINYTNFRFISRFKNNILAQSYPGNSSKTGAFFYEFILNEKGQKSINPRP